MKKITSFRSAVMMIAVLTLVTSFTSCKKEDAKPQHVALRHTTLSIEDAKKQRPSSDNALLWNVEGHVPILDRDGHQLTLGEYNKVSGDALIKCINSGTHVTVNLKGLIPNGVYSLWLGTFKSPGFDDTWNNVTGGGSLGTPDGSQNVFIASANGTAALSVIQPAGPLSEGGSVGDCLFFEKEELHILGAYHLDNQTHGPHPGVESSWVIQFDFPL